MFSNKGTQYAGTELKGPEDLFKNTEFIGKTSKDPEPDIVGYGHIHTPCLVRYKNKTLFNTGSVGIPVEMMNSDVDDKSNKFSTLASYIIIEGNYNSNKLTKAKEILHHYNQEHLLNFYDELSEEQKELLLNQILGIDFNKILTLYKNSFKSTKLDLNTVSPLPHIEKDKISKEDLEHYIAIGENIIKSGFLAIVTMAGGQGTRLGYKGPKGTYELDFEQEHCRKSLFEIMCENIKNANNQYDITLPWYIMIQKNILNHITFLTIQKKK